MLILTSKPLRSLRKSQIVIKTESALGRMNIGRGLLVLAVILFDSSIAFAEEQSTSSIDLGSLICQSLHTPYEKKQDQLRAKSARSFKEAQKLIKENKNEEARLLLQEMLALEGRKKLTTREAQFASFYLSQSYRNEGRPKDAATWTIKTFYREGQIQSCEWETCATIAVSLGEQYKSMLNYEDAKIVFETMDNCPDAFTDKLINKANFRLFEIASKQSDAAQIIQRGNWLLKKDEETSNLDPESVRDIRAAISAVSVPSADIVKD